MDENKIFLKTVEEKYERFLDYYTMMSSDFLSLEQQSALAGFLRAHSKENLSKRCKRLIFLSIS